MNELAGTRPVPPSPKLFPASKHVGWLEMGSQSASEKFCRNVEIQDPVAKLTSLPHTDSQILLFKEAVT